MALEASLRASVLKCASVSSLLACGRCSSSCHCFFRHRSNGRLGSGYGSKFHSASAAWNRASMARSRMPERATSRRKIEDLVMPVYVPVPKAFEQEEINLDSIAKPVTSEAKSMVLDEFRTRPIVRELAEENGMNERLFVTAFKSFRNYCRNAQPLDAAISVIFSDIVHGGTSVDSLFPFFLSHARRVFPHLECMDDLRMISDLTQPHNWYPEARQKWRKIVFHAGPTNSGKTFEAMKHFLNAKNGVYCGPLKLLASEVFTKANNAGVNCDMVTGEERRFAVDRMHPSAHLACTVEMLSTQMRFDVAVIDEIQMLRDEQRGWAWTRALLGVAADEVHLCGEPAAVDIVQELLDPIGEHVVVNRYERKSELVISNHGLGSLDNLQDGDCLVCFSRRAIYKVTKELDRLGIKCAVIYGDLPPGTKLAQAAKFNDPQDPTNVLVSTDAIGMGLNLNIRRVIFYSVARPPFGEFIPTYQALQIAGRAGRYGSKYEEGKGMALTEQDNFKLNEIISKPVEPIKKVGIAPTFEQLETFSFHLPKASFINLLDIFVSVCSITDRFFICTVDQMKTLAELIEYIPLQLRVRYTLCISPIDVEEKIKAMFFVKVARRFSSGQALTFEWLCEVIEWPPPPLKRLMDLLHLEHLYDIVDVYLWLSLRFPDMMPGEPEARQIKSELDRMIEDGISRILELLSPEDDAKIASAEKKAYEKARTARERNEFENSVEVVEEKVEDQAANEEKVDDEVQTLKVPLKLSQKRKGKKLTLSESLVAKGLLSAGQLEQLKAELRREEVRKLRNKK